MNKPMTSPNDIVLRASNIAKVYPCEALVILKGQASKAAADQIATVSKLRLKERIASLPPDTMEDIKRAIRIQLSLLD